MRAVSAGGLLVGIVAAVAYFPNLARQPWFADESAYIAQSYYYHLLFHQGDLWHPDWQRRAGIEVPPVPKYLIGLALDLAGLEAIRSPEPAERWYAGWFQPPADPRVLPVARVPSAVMGTLGAVGLYLLTVRTWSVAAGLAAALLWALNPLVRMSACRAMGDAATECLVLWTVLLAAVLTSRLGQATWRWRSLIGWALLLAIVGSLAINAKLNGAVGLMSAAVMAAAVWVRGLWRGGSPAVRWAVPLGGLGVVLVAFACLCLVNPFLLGGGPDATVFTQAARLVEHRAALYGPTRELFHRKDGTGLFTLEERIGACYRRAFGSYATLHPMLPQELIGVSEAAGRDRWTRDHPLCTVAVIAPVSAALAAAGLILPAWRRRGDPTRVYLSRQGPWLAYLVVATASVVTTIPLDWDRYYIPLLAPWAAAMGIALSEALIALKTVLRRKGG